MPLDGGVLEDLEKVEQKIKTVEELVEKLKRETNELYEKYIVNKIQEDFQKQIYISLSRKTIKQLVDTLLEQLSFKIRDLIRDEIVNYLRFNVSRYLPNSLSEINRKILELNDMFKKIESMIRYLKLNAKSYSFNIGRINYEDELLPAATQIAEKLGNYKIKSNHIFIHHKISGKEIDAVMYTENGQIIGFEAKRDCSAYSLRQLLAQLGERSNLVDYIYAVFPIDSYYNPETFLNFINICLQRGYGAIIFKNGELFMFIKAKRQINEKSPIKS